MHSPIDWNTLWQVFSGILQLHPDAFQQVQAIPDSWLIATLTVFVAGLSLAIGQSVTLFVNRVRPIRFVFSLLINAVLYACGFLFLVISTWCISWLPWLQTVPPLLLFSVFGVSYVPLVFSCFGAIPYLGVPLLSLLSVWHLLALVVGLGELAAIPVRNAFWYVVVGWVMLQLLQRTIGQPIANLGRWLANAVAGVSLVTGGEALLELLRSEFSPPTAARRSIAPLDGSFPASAPSNRSSAQSESSPSPTSAAREFADPPRPTDDRSGDRPAPLNRDRGHSDPVPPASAHLPSLTSDGAIALAPPEARPSQGLLLLGLVGMALFAVVIAILLEPLRTAMLDWYGGLPSLFRYLLDLLWIGIVAAAVAGLLAPLETLGWWAGWYNDEIDTTINTGILAEPIADPDRLSRYVIYLDGVGQSSFKHLPDIEDFLDTLTPQLPDDVALIRGLMVYSVLNNPLNEDRPLTFLWQLADRLRLANPSSLLGLLVNLRNVWIVLVSADKRYGPIYNQGIAQVMYNALVNNGYTIDSGIPITLIGYSGGAQMACAAAPFLKRGTGAPIDVISLGGVISGNCNLLVLEQLYHLTGDRDNVERLGAILFPGRWKLFPLSYWNRAKRLGNISQIPLGPMGHQVPGGMLDPRAYLDSGQSYLQWTIDRIVRILQGNLLVTPRPDTRSPSNYDHYKQAAFTDPAYYPLQQSLDANWYQPIAPWMGRLILPLSEERSRLRGVWLELYHAPQGYESLQGQVVKLTWVNQPIVKNQVRAVTRDVHFSAAASYSSEYGGLIHPERLNHWQQVGPLESLAGAHPVDDLVVMLEGEVEVEAPPLALQTPDSGLRYAPAAVLRIANQPIEITGRFVALVRFESPIADTDRFQVVHFNPASRQFDGPVDQVRLPPVQRSIVYGSKPSTRSGLATSPLNATGWYLYGAADADGVFVVQALAPRALLRLQPTQVQVGRSATEQYLRREVWQRADQQKGQIQSVLCLPQEQVSISSAPDPIASDSIAPAQWLEQWQVGDRALVLHTYGGIGGEQREPAAASPIFFGHFAYGMAQVIQDPLTADRRFEMQYYQVYTHNTDGLTAGTLHWSRYMGDRQFGWLGSRPVCDILIKLDAFTQPFHADGKQVSALAYMLGYLQVMTARYRIGDGTGGTYVGPANNCAQDSNRALFASLRTVQQVIQADPIFVQQILQDPEQAQRYQTLLQLSAALRRELQPLGAPRLDWERNEYNLGSTLEDQPLRNLWIGLSSWRTLLPRRASDTIVRTFLRFGASIWILRTNQVGGDDPTIEPIAPMTVG